MSSVVVRFLAVLLVLTVGGLAGGTAASAAQQPPGVIDPYGAYESPNYGFEVTWGDGLGLWTVIPAQTGSEEGFDSLMLESDYMGLARVQIFGIDPALDPERILSMLLDNAAGNIPDAEVVDEQVDGPAPWVSYEYDAGGVQVRRLLEARLLESGDALVAVSLETTADLFDTYLMVALGDIDLDGESLFVSQAADGNDEPAREPDNDPEDEDDRPGGGSGNRDDDDGPSSRGATGDTYESVVYGYTLTYDPDEWEIVVENDDPTSSYDYAILSNGVGVLTIAGDSAYDEDQFDTCVEDYVDDLASQETVSDLEPLDERGAEGEDDDRAWATYSYSDEASGDLVRYTECRWLGDGLTLVIVHAAPIDDYEDEAEAREDLLDGFAPAAAGSGDDRDDDDEDDRDDRDDRRSSGDVYESPNYGFTLTYDPGEWEVASEDDDPTDPYDRVMLSNGVSAVVVTGDPDYDSDEMDDCLADYYGGLDNDDDVSDIEPVDERGAEGEDDDRAWATYSYSDEEVGDAVRYYECRWLGDGLTLVVIHVAPAGEYDDEIEAREDLLDGLAPSPEEGLG